MWRAHIGYLVICTLGVATHDSAKAAAAKRDLASYVAQFSQFVGRGHQGARSGCRG